MRNLLFYSCLVMVANGCVLYVEKLVGKVNKEEENARKAVSYAREYSHPTSL